MFLKQRRDFIANRRQRPVLNLDQSTTANSVDPIAVAGDFLR
jgi:hypothetical protein